ncbi:GntR family transcriptional regulator [Stenotrophomonas sp. NPDC087984]
MTVPKAEQDAVDQRSLHERIAADLRDEIMSGDLPPGAKLPSTAQLKERFTASNATVQKALQLLKDEGLAVGRAGAAVTVREHRQRTMRPASYMAPAAPGEPYRWISEAANHQARGCSRLLDVTEIRPPADVAEALRLPADGTALLRAQVLLMDDEPVELVKSYYPLELARGTAMMDRRKIKGGTPALLAELGYPPRLSGGTVVAGHHWALLSDLGRPRDGPDNSPAAHELMGASRARGCAWASFRCNHSGGLAVIFGAVRAAERMRPPLPG